VKFRRNVEMYVALFLVSSTLISCSNSRRSRSKPYGSGSRSAMASQIPVGMGVRVLARLAALDLNGDQRRQIGQIQKDLQESLITSRAAVSRTELDLRGAMAESPHNIPAIQQKLESKYALLMEIDMARIAAIHAVHPVLTDEQREKFDDPTWQPCGGDGRPQRQMGGGRPSGRGPGGGPPGRW